jgi:hypothetical protein
MSDYFTYNASALAIGGALDFDGRRVIVPSLASVALSPTGGEGSSSVINYNENGISFSSADTKVIGFDNNGEYTTYSTVLITGLNILNRLKIDFMEARVESRHVIGDESQFSVEASYRGVEVDGVEVAPVIDLELCSPDYSRFDALARRLRGSSAMFAERFGMLEEKLTNTLDDPSNPPLRASLAADFKIIERKPGSTEMKVSRAPHKAHGLLIPHLGRAHFAEYLVKAGRRRITLLRLDFDTKHGFHDELDAAFKPEVAEVQQRQMKIAAIKEAAALSTTDFSGSLALASVDGNGSPPWKP